LHNDSMLDVQALKPGDMDRLSSIEKDALMLRMLAHIGEQSKVIQAKEVHIEQQHKAIKFKDAKIEKITFEMQRLKSWQFGAHSERMTADQRQLFEDTLVEDQESLQAELDELLRDQVPQTPPRERVKPRRHALPEHLRRVEHHHEPEDTTCACGKAMVRIGEDMSERLDVIPAEFFVHRHIRGKWACKCCEKLVQEPVDPQIIDSGIPTAGLLAYLLVSRFVDHLPYYRIEKLNARSGVHTPRSTLAAWAGRAGAALTPLYEALRTFALSCRVLHVDETPVSMLDPGAGKTKRAYVWGYARSVFDAQPCVVYEFCAGRGAKYPVEFLKGWDGTIVCDDYKVYETVAKIGVRSEAGCAAHARRKFDELDNRSPIGVEAIRRFERIYRIERAIAKLSNQRRLEVRKALTQKRWDALHEWLRLERSRVADGSATARALDYSLKRWPALSRFLEDGDVAFDNNHLENQIRPWAVGRKGWLFAGSELAGQRAAMVMSLVQSAKLNGHDPWAYLRDVLGRLPTHLNSRIDELLPHRWAPR
jgi:transposase